MDSSLFSTVSEVCFYMVFCSVRLSVRSLDFQSGKTGSTPVPSAILKCIAEQTNGGEPMSSAFQYGRWSLLKVGIQSIRS